MPVLLAGLWGRIAPYVLAVGAVLAVLLGLYFTARRAGEAAAQARQLSKTLEIKDAQQNAAAVAPRGRDAVADGLRRGDF